MSGAPGDVGQRLGQLGLADARRAFDEHRPSHARGQEHDGRDAAVGDVARVPEPLLDVLHGLEHAGSSSLKVNVGSLYPNAPASIVTGCGRRRGSSGHGSPPAYDRPAVVRGWRRRRVRRRAAQEVQHPAAQALLLLAGSRPPPAGRRRPASPGRRRATAWRRPARAVSGSTRASPRSRSTARPCGGRRRPCRWDARRGVAIRCEMKRSPQPSRACPPAPRAARRAWCPGTSPCDPPRPARPATWSRDRRRRPPRRADPARPPAHAASTRMSSASTRDISTSAPPRTSVMRRRVCRARRR